MSTCNLPELLTIDLFSWKKFCCGDFTAGFDCGVLYSHNKKLLNASLVAKRLVINSHRISNTPIFTSIPNKNNTIRFSHENLPELLQKPETNCD